MRFLVDTRCWLWAFNSPEKLQPEAVALIENAESIAMFSAVSALEIAIKYSAGKLELPEPPEAFVRSRMTRLGMSPLPVYLNHALRVGLLPHHHRDPFDRLSLTLSTHQSN